jgi:hypothetical protein
MSIIPENALKEIRGVVTQSNGNSHLYEYDEYLRVASEILVI